MRVGIGTGTDMAKAPKAIGTPTTPRNPAWTRDELILALDLYLRHRNSPPSKDSAAVKELSSVLNELGRAVQLDDKRTFRNSAGVYMKMMNFRRFDPDYTAQGKVGLQRGNKDEEVVWQLFANDPQRLTEVSQAIRGCISGRDDSSASLAEDEPEIQDAEEGRILTRVHRQRERSRKLVEQVKAMALKKSARLVCAACGFDFVDAYGPSAGGIIDVHHTKPLHTLAEGHRTSVHDLALLCANCHRVVHASRPWLSVEEVAALHIAAKQSRGAK
jgi:predicted HNH restriction endonuclease